MKEELATLVERLGHLAAAGFTMGPEWEAVHTICQAHEGEPLFDWGHALCHRVEGDDANAAYWYRRAGKPQPRVSLSQEWEEMKIALSR
jgi:hypothetical protein